MTFLLNLIIITSYSQYFMDKNESDYSNKQAYEDTLVYERLWDPRFLYQR